MVDPISRRRLRQLEAKERAHDDYLAGMRAARRRYAVDTAADRDQHPMFVLGYRTALEVIAKGILEAAAVRDPRDG